MHRSLPACALVACSADVVVLDSDAVPSTTFDGGAHADGTLATDGATADAGSLTLCEEARTRSDFVFLENRVFVAYCATMGCHSGPAAEVDLRLDAGYARTNLVNRGSSTQSTWIRVVPGSPSTSYLMVALGRAPGPPPRDGFMPLGGPALCVEIHQAIERWIAAGAP